MPQPNNEKLKRKSTRQVTMPRHEILNAGQFSFASADAHVVDPILSVDSNEQILLDHLDLTIGSVDDPVDVEIAYMMVWLAREDAFVGPIVDQLKNSLVERALWFHKQRWRTIGTGDGTVDVYVDIDIDFDDADNIAEPTRAEEPDDTYTLCLVAFADAGLGVRIGWAGEISYRRRMLQRQWPDLASDWAGYEYEEQFVA